MTRHNDLDRSAPEEAIEITLNEHLLTLTEATSFIPGQNGKRPSVSTVWRWCRKGLNGVRLEYVRCGRKILTSREALSRFIKRLAEADIPPDSSPGNSIAPFNPLLQKRNSQNPDVSELHSCLEREGL